jgi:hypothetical protein
LKNIRYCQQTISLLLLLSLLNLEEIPRNCNEKDMRYFVTEKIMKDRLSFMTANCGEEYPKNWNKDAIKEKLKEFKRIEVIHKSYYDPKTIKYYLPHIFKVNDDKIPD